jgi:hypothetical protein
MCILRKIEMNITRKSIISTACAIVLASGLYILLVLLTAPASPYFSPGIQKFILVFIFALLLFLGVPLTYRRFDRLPDIRMVLGWTFMGLGVEFILFPFMLLIYIMNLSQVVGIILGISILTMSFIFAFPSGLISIIIGISLIKRR